MEESPKIERLISSHGITLSDAANILKSYLTIIDDHHGPRKPKPSTAADDGTDAAGIAPSSLLNGGDDDDDHDANKKSRQQDVVAAAEETEEERLLARLNQLDPKESSNNNRLGSISEDVYERLQMIMESVCGEVEGRVVSAAGVYASSSSSSKGVVDEQSGGDDDEGAVVVKEEQEVDADYGEDEFTKELEEAEQRLETDQHEEEQQRAQPQQKLGYEQKKKDKKAKKAAKKAKKEAKKRKAGSVGATEEKRIKVEEEMEMDWEERICQLMSSQQNNNAHLGEKWKGGGGERCLLHEFCGSH